MDKLLFLLTVAYDIGAGARSEGPDFLALVPIML